MNKCFILALLSAMVIQSLTAMAEVPILGTESKVSLSDVAGTPTLVTVILKESGARDANLQILEVREDRIVVLTSKGEAIPYLLDSIESIEVQGGAVEVRRAPQIEMQVMRAEHQRIVDRAWSRVREIYDAASDDQDLRIQAAVLLALTNDSGAHNYLRQLAESNDIMIQLQAAGALFLVGDVLPEALLRQGLDSGNRNARSFAASLAGLTLFKDGEELLRVMSQDRAVQLSAPATRALARLGDQSIVPRTMGMIMELHEEKGEAAIFALTQLAASNPDIVDQIKFRLLEADGMIRYRLVRILYNLKDPLGIDELKHIFKNYPTLTPEVALLLAHEGDWEATQYLKTRLGRREDPTEPNLRFRARNAQALFAGGDPSAMAVFQELLRTDNDTVIRDVFNLMTELGNPRLITLLQPSIENVDQQFAMGACQSVIALALPQFRERLILYRAEFKE
jgi:HEAT repeat protein